MIVSGNQCQLMAQYIISDLTEKANEATERFEIEALKLEAERLGLQIDFEVIFEQTKQEAIQYERDQLYFNTFGI
jgi:hypothetical protein